MDFRRMQYLLRARNITDGAELHFVVRRALIWPIVTEITASRISLCSSARRRREIGLDTRALHEHGAAGWLKVTVLKNR